MTRPWHSFPIGFCAGFLVGIIGTLLLCGFIWSQIS